MSISTTVEHVVEIAASPRTLYDLWTTADGLVAWWGIDATTDARPGGEIRVDIDGRHVMVGEFVELDPPNRIVFTFGWLDDDLPPGSTTVEVLIDAHGDLTRVTVRHAGLPVELIESHARGWVHFVGDRLPGAAT